MSDAPLSKKSAVKRAMQRLQRQGISPTNAADIVRLLSAIRYDFECFNAGAEANLILNGLSEKIDELRNVLWHEMPLELARIMDAEDGLKMGRGKHS